MNGRARVRDSHVPGLAMTCNREIVGSLRQKRTCHRDAFTGLLDYSGGLLGAVLRLASTWMTEVCEEPCLAMASAKGA